jgi:hypothetical protein
MSRLKSWSTLQATLFRLGHTLIDAWIQKMEIDGDGGRREFGLRGQRRGRKVIEQRQIRSPDIKGSERGSRLPLIYCCFKTFRV